MLLLATGQMWNLAMTTGRRCAISWLSRENPSWPGNYKVCYWCSEWQELICGAGASYLNRILNAGFDGVYLDIVDAFEEFEG